MVWSLDEYINGQITKIKELKGKGYTDRDILDTNEFCHKALRACNIPITYLIPKVEGNEMTFQEWETHTSNGHKWEYFNGYPFGSEEERDKILLGLLYSSGIRHFLEILPTESMTELIQLVNKMSNN